MKKNNVNILKFDKYNHNNVYFSKYCTGCQKTFF